MGIVVKSLVKSFGAVTGNEVARLIELPVIRQMHLGHHAQHGATVNRHGAVVQRAQVPQRRAHQQQRHQVGRARDDALDGGFHRVEKSRLLQQVAQCRTAAGADVEDAPA